VGAIGSFTIGGRPIFSNRAEQDGKHQSIRAVIIARDQCEALGHKVRAAAPLLALCRELIEAGHDPACQLRAYRDGVLALRVRSIGEAAQLSIRGDGVGFRCGAEMAQASHSMSPLRRPSHDHGAERDLLL
jgi:hypothetical protein